MPGLTDTDEVRATTRRLTDALYDWLCLPITAYERAAKNGQVPASREVPDMGKELARAVEQRDRLQSHLDSALAQMDSMDEVFRAPLEMTVIVPMRMAVEAQERYISDIQARIEETALAVAQSEEKTENLKRDEQKV